MWIVNLTPIEPGVYSDHSSDCITKPPKGWAMIPEGFEVPSTFPRCDCVEAEDRTYVFDVEEEKQDEETGEIVTVIEQRERIIKTVIKMTESTLQKQETTPVKGTEIEQLRADVDYIAVMTGVRL